MCGMNITWLRIWLLPYAQLSEVLFDLYQNIHINTIMFIDYSGITYSV